MQEALRNQKARGGAGLHFLTPPMTSPSLAALLGESCGTTRSAKWHQYDAVVAAGRRPRRPADARSTSSTRPTSIVALDSDFLTCGPGSVRYSKDFARRRRLTEENTSMNRLYAIESSPTLTGAKADHRLRSAASEVEHVARELAAACPALGGTGAAGERPGAPDIARWVAAIAKDLQAHKGRSVVVAGEFQTDAVTRRAPRRSTTRSATPARRCSTAPASRPTPAGRQRDRRARRRPSTPDRSNCW